jgi:hypothetical protein
MGWWTDIAIKHPGTPNHGGAMVEQRGLVVHIAEGSYQGTISWIMNPDSSVSSHFVVSKSGEITQMLDTDVVAWTQAEGNGHWLSVENEGYIPNPLTPAQVEANARIFRKGHEVYGYPLVVANSPSDRGLGHHSMGAENGVYWGHSECPGQNIKAQKPDIVAKASGSTSDSEVEVMRYVFNSSIPGADTHVHVTDGLRYRIQPASYQVDNALNKGGAGTIVTLTSADLPSGWDFGKLRQAVCGLPDTGDYYPPADLDEAPDVTTHRPFGDGHGASSDG